MSGRTKAFELSSGERKILERMAFRIQIVLSLADGAPARAVARKLHTSRNTVDWWRGRYEQAGRIALLGGKPGRKRNAGARMG